MEGAFTGSRKSGKRGLIETAHTGTLFLDQIGDMPVTLQTRLLRVLQEREVMRVGGVAPIPVDVRVIAATHQPLEARMSEGRFRSDLYYRTNILRLEITALRERREDIGAMTRILMERNLRSLGSGLDAGALLLSLNAKLVSYYWPGNVRELENICERVSVLFARHLNLDDALYSEFALDCAELFPNSNSLPGSELSAAKLQEVLAACHGNRLEAARRLGISRSTLWRRTRSLPAAG